MATTLDRHEPDTRGWCNPPPVKCPECGDLECLCRPRFFAGQLLTEQDLNRLDSYIKKKNQLHNRYLHGWGVVCGLEVTCDPCNGFVRVSPGYALSPCGDDIVVCEADNVPICDLIKKCRDRDRGDMTCRPYGEDPNCADRIEEWVLAIRYEETPSRGITALRGGGCAPAAADSCGCSCASGGPCTCGQRRAPSGGQTAAADCGCAPGKVMPKRNPLPQCEPTLICEGYRYELFRLPTPPKRDPRRDPNNPLGNLLEAICGIDGPMFANLCCCWEQLFDSIPKAPTAPLNNNMTANDRQIWFTWFCDVKTAFVQYFTDHPLTNCRIFERLQAIAAPPPTMNSPAFVQALSQATVALAEILFEALVACLCSAMLPHCPPPATDPRVPLATIKVRARDCKIISVCNWTPLRRFVLTWPTMGYWFGWLPIFKTLRENIHRLCCVGLTRQPGRDSTVNVNADGVPRAAFNAAAASTPDMGAFALTSGQFFGGPSMASALMSRLERGPIALDGATFAAAMFQQRDRKESLSIMDDEALEQPDFKVLSALASTFTAAVTPASMAAAFGSAEARKVAGGADTAADFAMLRSQVVELQRTLATQTQELAALRRDMERNG